MVFGNASAMSLGITEEIVARQTLQAQAIIRLLHATIGELKAQVAQSHGRIAELNVQVVQAHGRIEDLQSQLR